MRLVTISYIGNEEDIVESFVRHHVRIADRMIIVCTSTDDATAAILNDLQKEGLPIELSFHQPEFHDQAQVLTDILHSTDADWVLPLDADEFVQCKKLHEALASLPQDRVTLLPWRTYVPMAGDNTAESDVRRRITHRRAEEDPQFFKILIPGALVQEKPVIAAGNHALHHAGTTHSYPTTITSHITLAHFPVRSAAQIRRKASQGWLRTLAKPLRGERESFHWKDILDTVGDKQLSQSDVTTIALQYAGSHATDVTEDPVTMPTQETAVTQ